MKAVLAVAGLLILPLPAVAEENCWRGATGLDTTVLGPGAASSVMSDETAKLVVQSGLCPISRVERTPACVSAFHLLSACHDLAVDAGMDVVIQRQNGCPPINEENDAWKLAKKAPVDISPRKFALDIWRTCIGLLQLPNLQH